MKRVVIRVVILIACIVLAPQLGHLPFILYGVISEQISHLYHFFNELNLGLTRERSI